MGFWLCRIVNLRVSFCEGELRLLYFPESSQENWFEEKNQC